MHDGNWWLACVLEVCSDAKEVKLTCYNYIVRREVGKTVRLPRSWGAPGRAGGLGDVEVVGCTRPCRGGLGDVEVVGCTWPCRGVGRCGGRGVHLAVPGGREMWRSWGAPGRAGGLGDVEVVGCTWPCRGVGRCGGRGVHLAVPGGREMWRSWGAPGRAGGLRDMEVVGCTWPWNCVVSKKFVRQNVLRNLLLAT